MHIKSCFYFASSQGTAVRQGQAVMGSVGPAKTQFKRLSTVELEKKTGCLPLTLRLDYGSLRLTPSLKQRDAWTQCDASHFIHQGVSIMMWRNSKPVS